MTTRQTKSNNQRLADGWIKIGDTWLPPDEAKKWVMLKAKYGGNREVIVALLGGVKTRKIDQAFVLALTSEIIDRGIVKEASKRKTQSDELKAAVVFAVINLLLELSEKTNDQ